MSIFDRAIEEVVTSIERHDGVVFAVVRFDCGEYGISQNGQLIRAYVWPEEHFEDCRSTMRALAGQSPRTPRQVYYPPPTKVTISTSSPLLSTRE